MVSEKKINICDIKYLATFFVGGLKIFNEKKYFKKIFFNLNRSFIILLFSGNFWITWLVFAFFMRCFLINKRTCAQKHAYSWRLAMRNNPSRKKPFKKNKICTDALFLPTFYDKEFNLFRWFLMYLQFRINFLTRNIYRGLHEPRNCWTIYYACNWN